jgi:hypothetical protein
MTKWHLNIGVLLLFFGLILGSCTSKEKEITQNTKGFLDAYFSVDYKGAATYCTKELGEELVNSLKRLDSLEPSVREMLEKQSKEVKTEIISINTKGDKDIAKVLYKVILPNFPQGIENTITLKKVDKKWCIEELGN